MNMYAASNHMFQLPPMLLPAALDNTQKWKPHVEIAPNCPRCSSSNTKFCYYNNYSLSQPRYFCKGCRRYWTKGGSLRNVPVGGGCRKSRRSKSYRVSSSGERASVNYNGNGTGTSSDDRDHQRTDKNCESGNGSSPDIDLAAVFAKFLSDSSGSPQDLDNNNNNNNFSNLDETSGFSTDGSNSLSTPDSVQNDVAYPDSQKPHDHQNDDQHRRAITGETSLFIDDFPRDDQLGMDQDLLEMDEMDALGLQNLLNGDEVLQDALWSTDADTAMAAHNSSPLMQPILQMQEFDCFQSDHDDQLKSSPDLISGNWSSFDLSGFQVYSSGANYY